MNYLIYIIGSLLFSAFFSGMEIAFVSANKLRIELDKKQGFYGSGIISIFSKNPTQYIATMLIGNNIALVIYGLVMAIVLEPYIAIYVLSEGWILFFQTVISTIIILLTAEFLPKTIFQINPNFVLNVFSVPVFFFYILFYIIAKPTVLLSNFFLKSVLKTKISDSKKQFVFGKIDLNDLINTTNDNQDAQQEVDHEIKIFQNALDFSKVKLRECIVPRTEISAVEINDNLDTLKANFIETGYSKILVYKDTIDNIIGYASSLDLFKKPEDIKSMIHSLIIVPESMPANKLLEQFIQERKSIAIVVDEFGGTSGMVTIEDIIEEIFGEIEDEHDTIDLIDKVLKENEYLLSGRLEIDYLNEKYNNIFPEKEEYETVAGFILFHHGNIPKINEIITIENLQFSINKVSKTRIELVKLKVLDRN
jgi:magnesium and cobalt exporter, CNNM family